MVGEVGGGGRGVMRGSILVLASSTRMISFMRTVGVLRTTEYIVLSRMYGHSLSWVKWGGGGGG